MSLRTPEQYLAALLAEGLQVEQHPGWMTTDRPGPWNPRGVINHHTGPYGSIPSIVDLLRKGRSDLPGPLCHAGLAPNGTVHLVGWNDTNHAGLGDPKVLEAVIADQLPPAPRSPSSTWDTEDGNAAFYGLEMIHPGDDTPWPDAQVEAAVRYNAAILRLHGWTPYSAIYHKGWTVRKVDPHGFPGLVSFRARISARLAHPASWNPGDPETEDDMPYTDTQLIDFARRAVQAELGDENVGEFSDRIVAKVLERLPAQPVVGIDLDALATAVADKLAQRLQS